jgi:cell division protein FtsB
MIRLSNSSAFSEVTLSEKAEVPNKVQVLRVGKFNHPNYGLFEITDKVLSDMKQNFDKRVRGIDVSFDYYHESHGDASGWVKSLELSADKSELWAEVEWTPIAAKKLADRELRYFSPDFAFKWTDPEGGAEYKNVLFGGGLTNRPFVKEMKAIVADENLKIGVKTMTELEKAQQKNQELEAQVKKLSEDCGQMEQKLSAMPTELEAKQQKIAALEAELAKLKGDLELALADKKKMEDAKMLAEKETAFNVLLSEGKACAAQKDAFIKGDMTEFIKLAQPTNLKPNGKTTTGDMSDEQKTEAILKLAEEKRQANPKMAYGESISLAKKEIESK